MNTLKKILSSVLVACVMLAMFAGFNTRVASAEIQVTHDYHYIEPGDEKSKMAIPKAYTVRNTVSSFKSKFSTSFKEPTDMFIDDDDNIYILDVGATNSNGRIVKMDMWGEIELEVVSVTCKECADAGKSCSCSKSNTMNKPQGIFVFDDPDGNPESDQHMFIADTGNQRIVHLDSEGYWIEDFVKPSDKSIADYPFDVKKIYIDNNGIMYLLLATDFQGFMTLNTRGEYIANTGMTWTTTSLATLFKNWFSNDNELLERATLVAPPYSNFMIDDNGWIYATIVQAEENQIAKLNTSGTNIYPPNVYGRNFYEITDMTTFDGTNYISNFVDITVDDQGIIYALDNTLGNVFLYDQEGNNLAYFGSKGTYRGRFQDPISIGLLSDTSVVVLDNKTGYVTTFAPTEFCTLVKQGTYHYFEAEYEEARSVWTKLLELDGNYVYAHKALGKAYFKEKNYDMAMYEYKLAKNTEGYSLAFEKKKGDIVDSYFFLIVLIIIVVIVAVVLAYRAVKKYIDKLHVKITTWGGDDE